MYSTQGRYSKIGLLCSCACGYRRGWASHIASSHCHLCWPTKHGKNIVYWLGFWIESYLKNLRLWTKLKSSLIITIKIYDLTRKREREMPQCKKKSPSFSIFPNLHHSLFDYRSTMYTNYRIDWTGTCIK